MSQPRFQVVLLIFVLRSGTGPHMRAHASRGAEHVEIVSGLSLIGSVEGPLKAVTALLRAPWTTVLLWTAVAAALWRASAAEIVE